MGEGMAESSEDESSQNFEEKRENYKQPFKEM